MKPRSPQAIRLHEERLARRYARLERMRRANPDVVFTPFEKIPEEIVSEWADLFEALNELDDPKTKIH